MNHMPPPDVPAVPPSAHAVYENAWQPVAYPPSFASESFYSAAASQAPLPPGIPNRELPHLPPDGPYGRPNSLSGSAHPVKESSPQHANYCAPNGIPEYRSRMGCEPPPQPTPSEAPPASATLSASSQIMTPAQSMPSADPTPYDPRYYQNPAYGARRRKAIRAQEVSRGRMSNNSKWWQMLILDCLGV